MDIRTFSKFSYVKNTVNKSIFHGYLYPISSVKEAKEIIAKLKIKHPGANHYAYAYSITALNERQKLFSEQNYSDDGEVSRTAGYPLLKLINSNNITNLLFVVIRFFGGIKLGTGGLMRAYSSCGQDTLKENEVIIKSVARPFTSTYHISSFARLENFLKKNKLTYSSNFLGQDVQVTANIPLGNVELEEQFLNFEKN